MKYTAVKNPRWCNPEHTLLECDVNFEHLPEEFVPFTPSPDDMYDHTKEIYARCMAGEFGPITPFTPPEGSFIPVVDVSPTQGV